MTRQVTLDARWTPLGLRSSRLEVFCFGKWRPTSVEVRNGTQLHADLTGLPTRYPLKWAELQRQIKLNTGGALDLVGLQTRTVQP